MTYRSIILLSISLMLSVVLYLQLQVTRSDAWTGTAWALNSEGYLVTAYHVVDGNKQLMVSYQGQWYPAKVVAIDKQQDIAIIKAPLKGLTPIPLSFEPPHQTPGSILGYPVPDVKGWNLKITTGKINGGIFKASYISFRILLCPGNSGGPVIDEFGAARGIVNRGYDAYEIDENHCTKVGDGAAAKYIQALAQKTSIRYTTQGERKARASNEWFTTYENSVLAVYGWN